jgi:hypothetical protein
MKEKKERRINPEAIDNVRVCVCGVLMLYSACYRIKIFPSFFFLFLFDIMQVTFTILTVKWSHTSDAPLPIYPVAFTNG